MASSLRTHLALFWMLLLVLCVGLAAVMLEFYRNIAGAQISSGRSTAEASCKVEGFKFLFKNSATTVLSPSALYFTGA
jgi:hypothetical protein